jgi:pimeloyl-ACP methyl ester carboxylesterase
MVAPTISRFVRPLEEVQEMMLERAQDNRNPYDFTNEEAETVTRSLTSLDRDAWARAFSAAAPKYEQRAREAEARGDAHAARDNYLLAYGFLRVARYPAPNSPAKKEAYVRSQDAYLKAARYFDPPIEVVEIPFNGRPGEGTAIRLYVRRPDRPGRLPVVMTWGGIDSFKEERRTDPYISGGFATIAIDMPGVGDAPIAGSEDAERLWDPVFDWLAEHPGLDGKRLGIVGASTGGYWAVKLAHVRRDRVAAAICHGGCAHLAFTPEWIEQSQHGEYPLELAETLACAFGMATFEDWVEHAPRFSLLHQGVLDQPCAPLLLVNGTQDSVFPIQDMYLLLEHGSPKSARLYPVGHMGHTPTTTSTMVEWLAERLGG